MSLCVPLSQAGDERDGGHEQNRMASGYGRAPERNRQVRLADAGRTQQQHVLAIGDPAGGSKIADLFGIDRRLGSEVEARQLAHIREVRDLQSHSIRRWSLRAISRSPSSAKVSRIERS